MAVTVGRIVGQGWRIESVIGHGATSNVFAANAAFTSSTIAVLRADMDHSFVASIQMA